MKLPEFNIPKWMVIKICELYPDMSTQAAIKYYLRDCLNKGTNYKQDQ